MTTTIDLSRLPAPNAIEALDYETLLSDFVDRFQAYWDELRLARPELPEYDVASMETDPVIILGQAWSYLRLLDRARVNDAVKAVLAPSSTGADLDHVVARQGITRLELAPATSQTPALMETDAALLRRYLLSFDRPSAGSASRYLYEAWTAAPTLHDVRVNGRAVHGRVGDTDVVIIGEDGDPATNEELAAVQAAISASNVKPEAVGIAALRANRLEYQIVQVIKVPVGPDAELVRLEAVARVTAAALSRMKIGASVPRDLLAGAAFGDSIVDVEHLEPEEDIEAEPYTVPVCTSVEITVEAAT
jgi:phage-related baseplate assembly protein